MTVDVVIPYKSGSDGDELRYALRSLCVNARPLFRTVWLATVDAPRWFTGGVIRAENVGRNADIRAKVTAATLWPEVAETILLATDDSYLVDPVTEFAAWDMGRFDAWADRINADGSDATWRRCVMETREWVRTHGGEDLVWQGHRPALFDKDKLRELLIAYPANQQLDAVGLWGLAGVGRHAGMAVNAKVRNDAEFRQRRHKRDSPWWSSNATSWNGLLGQHVRAMFPEACEFEGA